MIAVVGSIQTRSWDGNDGKKQYATEVIVDEAYFTGSKTESGIGGNVAMDELADRLEGLNEEYDEFADLNGSVEDLPF